MIERKSIRILTDIGYRLDEVIINNDMPTIDTSGLFEGDHWNYTPKKEVKTSTIKSLYDFVLIFGIALSVLFLLLSV